MQHKTHSAKCNLNAINLEINSWKKRSKREFKELPEKDKW